MYYIPIAIGIYILHLLFYILHFKKVSTTFTTNLNMPNNLAFDCSPLSSHLSYLISNQNAKIRIIVTMCNRSVMPPACVP